MAICCFLLVFFVAVFINISITIVSIVISIFIFLRHCVDAQILLYLHAVTNKGIPFHIISEKVFGKPQLPSNADIESRSQRIRSRSRVIFTISAQVTWSPIQLPENYAAILHFWIYTQCLQLVQKDFKVRKENTWLGLGNRYCSLKSI